jgi:hypothetical protein
LGKALAGLQNQDFKKYSAFARGEPYNFALQNQSTTKGSKKEKIIKKREKTSKFIIIKKKKYIQLPRTAEGFKRNWATGLPQRVVRDLSACEKRKRPLREIQGTVIESHDKYSLVRFQKNYLKSRALFQSCLVY